MNQASRWVLRAGSIDSLASHVARQLNHMMPGDGLSADLEQVLAIVPQALERMRPILAAVRNFTPNTFDHFNSLQYATWLYLLSNEQWRTAPQSALADRLFCLNRALNAIDLFYAVQMPEVFFISHGLGAVLGNATYGDRLVVFQNTTVGRVADDRPVLGRNVVLYPGATVTGASIIGENSVISAGTVVHGARVPDGVIVRNGADGLVMTPIKRDYASLYLRDSA